MAEQVNSTCQPSRVPVRWIIKTGRPYALPGCQDTSILPELTEGETGCGECNRCFFYRCRKCLPILLLDVLVPESRTEMVYIPDVRSIKPQKSDMFAENPDYHGEVIEFYANYLRRMNNLNGIAINSWGNKNARKIFLNTERTFDATKYERTEDFEIDWLIFTNSTMAVVEVGMRCETDEKDSEKKSKNKSEEERIKRIITSKVGQIVKDTIIISKLLEATDSSGILVYFFAVFPNIAFETVQKRIQFHQESLDSLFQPTNNSFKFGVISKNTIPDRTVHLYDQEGRFNEPTDFETLLTERTSHSQSQMYLASTVVSCMLMTSLTKKKNLIEANEFVVQKSSDAFPPVDEKKLCDKGTARSALGLPSKNRSKKILFPEEFLLGPEQIKAINSEADITFILGEAGTGKTLVLLAVLFKYTGKHLNEKKLRKVIFSIPKSKIHFRKDVEIFIKEYCQEDWVQIRETNNGLLSCSDNIYLMDEFYDSTDRELPFLLSGAKMWVVAVSTSSEALFNPLFTCSVATICLRKLYRSDPLISKLCAKVSRLVHQKRIEGNAEFVKIPWAMSTGDGIPYKSQNPIQVHLNQKNLNLKFCENEQNLVVYWNEEDFIGNSTQEKSNVIICQLEGYSLHDLVFTGSEFDNVVLVAGRNIDTTSQAFLAVLYKIISRARKTLKVFSHPSNLAEFESLLKFSDTDVYFDKQRCDDNLSSVTFSNLSSSKEDIRQPNAFKFSEIEKYIDPMVNHAEDPLSTYNKAFAQYFNADLRTVYQLIGFLINFAFSSGFQFNPETLAYFGELMFGGMIQNGFQFIPCNRFEFVDSSCKFMDEVFMKLFELSAPFFPELFIREHKQILEFCGKFETIRKNPFFMKFNMACYVLNAEEFRQFLDQLAISSDTLFAKIDGSFLIFKVALFKLNPDEFCEFLKSIGVHSLRLSNEQFLDDKKNNILMYCVTKTSSFYMVADWALEQGYLDELLSQRNCDGETCFVLACKCDNFGLVKMLLQKYHYDWLRDGFNAILALCKNGNILIFKYLLCTLKGENVKMMLDSMRGSEGESILMITTFNAKMMETFLNFSMEENFFDRMLYEKDALGHSCFFWAVILENMESIQLLIDRHKFDWRTDCDLNGYTIAHLLCALKRPDVLQFFVENYGHEFIEVAHELNYEGYSCLEIACFAGCSVEVVHMVLDTLNDSLPLPQNLTQLLRCLIAANEENGENKNKILDCLVSHMLQKFSFGYHEDKIKQHYLVYALDPEDMHEIGARILTGPKELEEADSGEPETFSLGSWQCIFWAVTEHKELRILTNQPVCKMSAILARSEGSCINIFASWEYLDFFIDNLADHRLPESRTPTCFKSWEEFYEKEFTGLDKLITRKCCNKNSHCDLVSLLEDIDLD